MILGKQVKVLKPEIIQRTKELAAEIDRYNTRVLLSFLKNSFDRTSEEVKSLKLQKQQILLKTSRIKSDLFVVLDIESLNKQF
jgi:hypothetical protein